jgi:hypothetical protein
VSQLRNKSFGTYVLPPNQAIDTLTKQYYIFFSIAKSLPHYCYECQSQISNEIKNQGEVNLYADEETTIFDQNCFA